MALRSTLLVACLMAVVSFTPSGLADKADSDAESKDKPSEASATEMAAGATSQPPKKKDESIKPSKDQTSLTQSIQGASGLSIQTMCTNCNSADLSLGGLGNEHVAMSCDGLPVPPGLAQIYMLSIAPPTSIDNVDVEKGAGKATLDAGAVGGEIELKRRETGEGLNLNVSADAGSYGWNGARLDLRGGSEWFSGSLLGSWGQSDAIDADDDGNDDQPEIDRLALEARGAFQLSNNHSLAVGATNYDETHIGGRAAFYQIVGGQNVWNVEDVDFTRAQYDMNYEGRFGSSQLNVNGLFAQRDADVDETLFGPQGQRIPTYIIEEQTRFGSATWSRPLGVSGRLRTGATWNERSYDVVDVRFNLFSPDVPVDQTFTFAQGEVQDGMGLFVEMECR